jgi:hypothetical protein
MVDSYAFDSNPMIGTPNGIDHLLTKVVIVCGHANMSGIDAGPRNVDG